MLSAYVLTKNSERLLQRVLTPLKRVADEVLVLDSGSTDRTLAIARAAGCRIEVQAFENFARQRQTAQDLCSHDHVLFVDSDEIMSDRLVDAVLTEKAKGFPHPKYSFRREWEVLGRQVRAIYPIVSPDYPVRMLDRRQANFIDSNVVHEFPTDHRNNHRLDAALSHITFPTRQDFASKLHFYTQLSGKALAQSGEPLPSRLNVTLRSGLAFVKWYFLKKGFLDGMVGLCCGAYAAR